MTGYNVSLQGNITGFNKITKAMQQYNTLGIASQKEQREFATTIGIANSKLESYLTGLNATLTMGIALIVSSLISAFTRWINKLKETVENPKKDMQNLHRK